MTEGQAQTRQLRIKGGIIKGAAKEGLFSFKGLPYARPPVGDLRWRPPQSAPPWEGARDCTAFAPHCPQPRPIMGKDEGSESEDCLYLNIWTPSLKEGEKLPVMVWIHGGGFTTGSGSAKYYDGAHLARKGVVMVTINYRLGPFGFFAHPALSKESDHGVSGNYGILDMIAALEWVKENISSFGGNPNCVTIFGESAGSAAVTCLMASPLAKGLFHRAIAESNFAMGLPRLKEGTRGKESAEKTGESIAAALGCDKDVPASLRAMNSSRILQASRPAQGIFGRGVKFRPVIDGWVFPEDPAKIFREGRQHPVPFMSGTNADEGTIFLSQIPIKHKAGYRLAINSLFKDNAKDLLSLYPVAKDSDIPAALNRMTTDTVFLTPVRFAVRAMEKTSSPGYFYHFTRVPRIAKTRGLGAFHALEISYVFGTMNEHWGFDATDRKLSEVMSSYWVNFAKNGNPNGKGLPEWPAYTKAHDMHLELGDEIRTGTGLRKKYCDAIESLLMK
jgi:para-nitrobenzyl esterase